MILDPAQVAAVIRARGLARSCEPENSEGSSLPGLSPLAKAIGHDQINQDRRAQIP